MKIERDSPCKVNLLLNILGKRPDGFHELETVFHPVNVCDQLSFERQGNGVQLTCSNLQLPTDGKNLVHRAATAFLQAAKISEGVQIHLKKKLPLAAGLGGGSGNAATTLLGLNELFDNPLADTALQSIAASLGSDVPFFLQSKPAIATGRGEKVEPLDFFPALRGCYILLIHPGFGISTPWAYQHLARFPNAFNGQPGRVQKLVYALRSGNLATAASEFYNSLESPAFEKFPTLAIYQEFLRANGAEAALMSGSGSTTFAIATEKTIAETLAEKFKSRFGKNLWLAITII